MADIGRCPTDGVHHLQMEHLAAIERVPMPLLGTSPRMLYNSCCMNIERLHAKEVRACWVSQCCSQTHVRMLALTC